MSVSEYVCHKCLFKKIDDETVMGKENPMEKETNINIDIVKIQMVRDRSIEYGRRSISKPQQLAELGLKLLKNADREMFILVCLNAKNFVNCIHLVTIGTVDRNVVSPREVVKAAFISNSIKIAFVHNLCGAAHKLCYVKFSFM
jgi:DNA repair protein RadC